MSTIWIDADACPRILKDVLCRAAIRLQRPLIFVAHQALQIPVSEWIRRVQVEPGFDAADRYIEENAGKGDLVITNDIPLAANVIPNGVAVINTRGEILDKENVRERLRVRNLMEEIRATGQMTGGPPPLDNADKAKFANALDRWLARNPVKKSD
ncbi:MAG: YaiI/YqxD family protein [Spongiibacteraceae bacterium]